jgi:hypothetical protein
VKYVKSRETGFRTVGLASLRILAAASNIATMYRDFRKLRKRQLLPA